MTVRELREKYLAFFESKGHQRFPSGSLIPIDVTGRLDETLLFNGAGMIQFKPYFRGIAKPEHPRLITCQKCVRTGDIDEVGDDTHLTFFEMLGNFSFGDYFKQDAIRYSWEFLTSAEWLGLDPARLSFTVFEEDDEAEALWKACGARFVVRLGEETNYWPAGAFSNGPPGPCGPNSEMFYWVPNDVPPPSPDGYTVEQWEADDACGNWVEIWNDVFIQYEWQGEARASGKGYDKTGMPELPFRSIDTGMGLDRTGFVLGGYRSVYDTDSFTPIFQRIDAIRGSAEIDRPEILKARRIIADHIRTATFCIADGILPSNNGRGYVLRRLIRRAVLKGQRTLGISEPFMHLVFEGVLEAMGGFYVELEDRKAVIVETLLSEEALFRRTLDAGYERLREFVYAEYVRAWNASNPTTIATAGVLTNLASAQAVFDFENYSSYPEALRIKSLPAQVAFQLYDTFGFPLEVTQEIAGEKGFEVDVEGYETEMKLAQARSRGSQEIVGAYQGMEIGEERSLDAPPATEFLGYHHLHAEATVVRVRIRGGKTYVSLDRTPLYATSGGQAGDRGTMTAECFTWNIVDTTKSGGIFWHEIEGSEAPQLSQSVHVKVDPLRRRTQRNHTATHLLHAALRQTLGTHVTQAGSYVGPDRLRFDFTHGKGMTPDEIAAVERIVNDEILENTPVTTYVDIPIAEAKARGAMALFGEKYGNAVRMVEIGDFSRELCGGTHVRSTGEIGLFKIVSESSAQSGVRRIEAITGESSYEHELDLAKRVREAAEILKTNPSDLVSTAERVMHSLKEEKAKREQAEMRVLTGGEAKSDVVEVNGIRLWRRNFGETDPKTAGRMVDEVAANQPNQVTLAAVVTGDKIQFIAKVGTGALEKGAHAGNLLREVAKVAGGGGGGKADFATAGGRDVAKIDEALAAAEALLNALS